MSIDNGAPQADGLSSLRDEAGKPSSPEASIPSAVAREAMRATEAHWRDVLSAYNEAKNAVEAQHSPIMRAAKVAYSRAAADYDAAIAAETPDHPLTGNRVYYDQPIHRRYSREVTGYDRVTGVIETWRPGVSLGPGYGAARCNTPGEIYVRLVLKSGKLGSKTKPYIELFAKSPKWLFEDAQGMAARSDATGTGAAVGNSPVAESDAPEASRRHTSKGI